jgi:hypothetical protein
MSKFLVVLFTVAILSGCVRKNNVDKSPGQTAWDNRDLISYEDKARGVVCYRVEGREGLSCLKMELQ